jgi:aminopeptidase N
MKPEAPRAIRLKDYAPSAFLIDSVNLDFVLDPTRTKVRARTKFRANPAVQGPAVKGPIGKIGLSSHQLRLDGEGLEMEAISIDGRALEASEYSVDDASLTLLAPPDKPFTLEISTVINPESNKALQGLYRSKGIYCTQCEAQGFRRITYFLDRPDVLAKYTVRIEADLAEASTLLSNGNPQERGTLDRGKRHYAVWKDPHPKPSYLFALVGGNLASIASTFRTKSGRDVDLRIYVEPGKEKRCGWAMDSLKRSMRWDEQRFGREYDLDVFNIVAVSDFNMGAMENKGLNIFNDRLILASPETATDDSFEAIEAVVAHEYFHNWTGNRITCRDWFQLCLKEGLTVYRDQEFSADERSRTVQRIGDVRQLKARQFAEDAGPLAHPVRPDSYVEINNFYTATVYEKGAELVRMIQTIVGNSAFRDGLDLYFKRHDGHAATVEQFITCFEDATGADLSQFSIWYRRRGRRRSWRR